MLNTYNLFEYFCNYVFHVVNLRVLANQTLYKFYIYQENIH